MKKYILSAVAIIMVAIASAFITKHDHKTGTQYYWYMVDASGNIVSGSQVFGGVKEDETYATNHLPCTAGDDADCIRGFESQITSFPTNATGDADPLRKQLP